MVEHHLSLNRLPLAGAAFYAPRCGRPATTHRDKSLSDFEKEAEGMARERRGFVLLISALWLWGLTFRVSIKIFNALMRVQCIRKPIAQG